MPHGNNVLTLHEAIVVVLSSCDNRTATTDFIATEINERKLYTKKDKTRLQASQVKLRTRLSKGSYHHLFSFTEPNIVTLKNI